MGVGPGLGRTGTRTLVRGLQWIYTWEALVLVSTFVSVYHCLSGTEKTCVYDCWETQMAQSQSWRQRHLKVPRRHRHRCRRRRRQETRYPRGAFRDWKATIGTEFSALAPQALAPLEDAGRQEKQDERVHCPRGPGRQGLACNAQLSSVIQPHRHVRTHGDACGVANSTLLLER